MWILMVEAGVALFLLVFIVWWTMFAGRKEVDRNEVGRNDIDRNEVGRNEVGRNEVGRNDIDRQDDDSGAPRR